MILGIVGSRDFDDYDYFKKVLIENFNIPKIEKIISGGAKGTDTFARIFADENDIPILEIKPDWNKHGKSAGFVRNKDIIDKSEYVLIFWNEKSKGTNHDITLCDTKKKHYTLVLYEKNEIIKR